jgi:hypothetical protein
MQIEKYETESTVDSLIYTFESIGERVIQKVVIYSKFENPQIIGLDKNTIVFNLAFGDLDLETGDFNDQVESKNKDTEKVLATVANTAFEFWEEYPDAEIFFRGSQPFGEKARRTRLYQMKINRYFADINLMVNIRGFENDNWEKFMVDKNYVAFLISQKKN